MKFQKSLIINVWLVNNNFILYTPEQNYYLDLDKELSEKIILFCEKKSNTTFKKENFLKISENKILEKLWYFFVKKWLFFERMEILSQLKNISRFFDNPALLERTDKDEEESYKLLEKNKEFIDDKDFYFLDLVRKSCRNFNWKNIDLKILEKIIYDSYFFNRNLHRSCPSGWAFYPLKFFYINNFSNKLYEFYNWSFKKVFDLEVFWKDFYLIFEEKWQKSSWILLIMSDLSFSSKKYWYKSLKLAYLEAWHFCQNFYLVSEKIKNLWVCEFAWVNEQIIYRQEKLKNLLFCSSIIIWKT